MLQRIINRINDLRPRQILMLAVAAGALMFLVIFLAFQSKDEPVVIEQKPIVEMVPVVVAKVNIPPRTRIQDTMLQMKDLPADAVPEGAIKNFGDVRDVAVKVSIFAGDVLTIQKVFAEKTDEGFIGAIPADCRAVSISVNDLTGVAGFAKPGDKVDLLLVEKGEHRATTNVLLQNVPLLSINQDTGSGVVDGSVTSEAISNPTIATFALPPREVLKLISASRVGEIYMMLRPANPNQAYVPEMEFTIESIDSIPKNSNPRSALPSASAPAKPAPQIPSAPPMSLTPKIEIIQGDKITQSAETSPATTNPSAPTPNLPVIPSNGNQPSPPIVSSPTN